MKTVALIPARYASERFPGKALTPIRGVPMIVRVYENVRRARRVDAVHVVTDDERIAEVVRGAGGSVLLEPSECVSGTDRIAKAASALGSEWIVNVQGDEPLMAPELVDAVVAKAHEGVANVVTASVRIHAREDVTNPNVVKVVTAQSGLACYFSRAPIPHVSWPRERPDGAFKKHVGIYAFSRDYLLEFARMPKGRLETIEGLEQLRALEAGHTIHVLETEFDSIGVDIPSDVYRVESELEARSR